jgi:coenzyme F420-0:L-glutamate ligase/coenzyme F420-1:gamma-L-glutamate ligase
MDPVQCYIIQGIPLIGEGDDLASIIEERFLLEDGDVISVASTAVAKSEGRMRCLDDYQPGDRAFAIAARLGRDPRFVQAVIEESEEILLDFPFLLVVTRFGHICVNAGIDMSNVGGSSLCGERILLLPDDPCKSARKLRSRLRKDCAVIITDTCGRPFRCGVAGVAIGWAGIAALRDWRGELDLLGRELQITQESIIDEIAGMANLLMGEGDGGTPAVVFRGLGYPRRGGELFRARDKDVIRERLRGRALVSRSDRMDYPEI